MLLLWIFLEARLLLVKEAAAFHLHVSLFLHSVQFRLQGTFSGSASLAAPLLRLQMKAWSRDVWTDAELGAAQHFSFKDKRPQASEPNAGGNVPGEFLMSN